MNVEDVDWDSVRDDLKTRVDGIRPPEYMELCDALEATHEDLSGMAAGGLVESAVYNGLLQEKSESHYAFTLNAIDALDEVEEMVDPIEPVDINLDESTETDTVVYPSLMKQTKQWICWMGSKQPRAPWQGHAYPVKWGAQLEADERPNVDFGTAQHWLEPYEGTNIDWPEDASRDLRLGYLLPHEPGENDVSLIDLDDVRDPETGKVHPVALGIIEQAGSYAEISQSGEGIHVFVVGTLPDGLGKVVEKIDDEPFVGDEIPKVEVYDHGRVVAMTGQHVECTPTEVAENQQVIDDIVDTYVDYEEPERTVDDVVDEMLNHEEGTSSNSEYSPYYNLHPAKLNGVGGSDWDDKGHRIRGPHPAHGSSNNDNCDISDDGTWYCFRHDVGGRGLKLLAVVEGYINCGDAGSDAFDHLTDGQFLKLCLTARDEYGVAGKPPYRALLTVAEKLYLVDEGDERLGEMYDIARDAYDEMTVGDV
ncbi:MULTISPECIES: hypothetical protein [Halorussus]|uniref:hypothetical protein n=1 Tax=Halorussus TaxID=1070314 RepID=UPI0020A189FD|nr:hypothetical protein [Halorussus vallis]USZ74034.1 hypothetical protein NGM07_11260 [Halorussus vallis]